MALPSGIELEQSGAITTIWFSRPAQHNAVSRAMFAALPGLLGGLPAQGVEVVLLRGRGGHYSAGADLHDVLAATDSPLAAGAYADLIGQAVAAVAACPLPTLAVLEGHAIGATLSLGLLADLRLATYEARLRLPYLHLGVVPDALTLRRLVALVGPGRARSLLFSGRQVAGAEAAQMGLVDAVVDAAALAPALVSTVTALCGASSFAVGRTKLLLAAIERGEALPLSRDMADALAHGDVAARSAAFFAPAAARPVPPRGN